MTNDIWFMLREYQETWRLEKTLLFQIGLIDADITLVVLYSSKNVMVYTNILKKAI